MSPTEILRIRSPLSIKLLRRDGCNVSQTCHGYDLIAEGMEVDCRSRVSSGMNRNKSQTPSKLLLKQGNSKVKAIGWWWW